MKWIFELLSASCVIAGVIGGFYVCFYQGWYLGIVGIIEAAQMAPLDGGGIAVGILRILLASFAGGITGWLFWMAAILFGSLASGLSRKGRGFY